MRRFKLLSLVGITSLALAHAGWAAGHGGGGGGHGGGGGGFHGGGFGGGGFPGGGFGGGVSAVAASTAVVVSVGDVSAVALSTALVFVVAVSVGGTGVATGAITDSLMMSSSAGTG